MARSITIAAAVLLMLAFILPAQGPRFEKINGRATDLGCGADGSVWLVGSPDKYGIYKFNPSTAGWDQILGKGRRIDVDPNGSPWVADHDMAIWRFDPNEGVSGKLKEVPGRASDIGIGADGAVWIIGSEDKGYGIYRWNPSINGWDQVLGEARRITVDPNGNPWTAAEDGTISQWVPTKGISGGFEVIPGRAHDLGCGADGSVWIVGFREAENGKGYNVYKRMGDEWEQVVGAAVLIDVDANGNPWIADSDMTIYRLQ